MNAREQFHDQIMHMLSDKPDKERSEALLLHDGWRADRRYEPGDVIRYGALLYKCLTAHTAQADWVPDISPSLWTQIMYKKGIRIIPEVIEATQAFEKDELGWWGEVMYKSLIDANVWTPEAYPQAWEVMPA